MIRGYDQLNMSQRNDFVDILDRFLEAQGVDARNNIIVKSVQMRGECFKIEITRYGNAGYQLLNPKTFEWS